MSYEVSSMSKEQEDLVLKNTKLVHYFVRRISFDNERMKCDYDDIVQLGMIGLIKAAKTYNGSVKFSSYAARCINNEIYMFFRKHNKWLIEQSLDDAIATDTDGSELTLGDITPSDDPDIAEYLSDIADIEKGYNIILNCFTLRDTLLLIYKLLNKTQREISSKLGISQSYVSRIDKKLKRRVKEIYESNVKIKEVYKVTINNEKFKISFATTDIAKFNEIMMSVLKGQFSIREYKIVRADERISLITSDFENIWEIISILIERISSYSINVINSPYVIEDKEKSDENIKNQAISSEMSEYDAQLILEEIEKEKEITKTQITHKEHNKAGTDEGKGRNAATVLRKYFTEQKEFTVKELIEKFTDISKSTITNTLYLSKQNGLIELVERGKYRVINK